MIRTFLIAFTITVLGCGGNEGRAPAVERRVPQTQEEMIQENRDAIKLENHDIDLYVKRSKFEMNTTGTGIRYSFLRDSAGTTAQAGQWAMVNYHALLLNGDTAYSSETGEPESFKVEMDDVESGLHEAIQLMSPGDSAVIIIPSYRAHGLIGDQNKIPMRSSIVYHIGLVKLSGQRIDR
ncbi:MAG: FKBP-type peptidyl-prolyl cis-trans isomerase [Bacteroidota bacterium]|nr:FKBP-type peptidyl-prolyl cis-trans isomerase [Bacteroidota bacterium]